MQDQFSRTRLLLGDAAMQILQKSRVAVFGVGGVGGYVCEALARSGVGAFDLIDDDRVCLTNLNRQIIATYSTLGRYKVDVARERMLEINPDAEIRVYKRFFLPENATEFPFDDYDYVVDAVDTVTAKLCLIAYAKRSRIPVISAMGAGNKLDPGQLRIADIYQTRVCPLARVMRRELRKRGIDSLKVVYSEEEPIRPLREVPVDEPDSSEPPSDTQRGRAGRKDVPGSTPYVPAVAGLLIAAEIVRDLTANSPREDLFCGETGR